MSYFNSVRYLYSLGNELRVGEKWGLERMQTLLAELGNPERGQRFVHIAGTNGKGSTSAMLSNALRHAGLRTGLYTSPHLIQPTERIQINGVPVSEQQFAAAFDIVHKAAETLLRNDRLDGHPSYFETVTAMAFVLFRELCDISVIEVGLGGRLDATNVITPELTVITPVSFDHESFLGNSIESIASEKAGILKPHTPAVISQQLPAAEAVIRARAAALGCRMILTRDFTVSELALSAYGSEFTFCRERFRCALAGRHQIENAKAAMLAAKELGLPTSAIQAGLADVRWPGRLERVHERPDFVVDGAHNPAGAAALAAYIKEFASDRPVWIVYAAMRDKAIDEVTALLFPLAQHLILTAPDYPRALRPEAILAVSNHPHATLTANVREAIAVAHNAPSEAVVFFTGSLFLVGEARQLLVNEPQRLS